MIAQQRRLIVGEERGDERCAGAIGVLGDAAGQRQRVDGGGHHQLLSGLEAKADVDGDGGELIEIFGVGAGFRGSCGGRHRLSVLQDFVRRGGAQIFWPRGGELVFS